MKYSAGLAKDIAHQAITRALKRGILKRPNKCSNCDKWCKPYAHHEDDDNPLYVDWLCARCHINRHKEIREMVV